MWLPEQVWGWESCSEQQLRFFLAFTNATGNVMEHPPCPGRVQIPCHSGIPILSRTKQRTWLVSHPPPETSIPFTTSVQWLQMVPATKCTAVGYLFVAACHHLRGHIGMDNKYLLCLWHSDPQKLINKKRCLLFHIKSMLLKTRQKLWFCCE